MPMYTDVSVSAGLSIGNTTIGSTPLPGASSLLQKTVDWGTGKAFYEGSQWVPFGLGWLGRLVGKASLQFTHWGTVEGTKLLWKSATPLIQDGIRHVEGNETAIAFDNWSKMVENRTMTLYEPYANITDTIANKTGTVLLNIDQAVTKNILDGKTASGFSASELIGPVGLTTLSGLFSAFALYKTVDHGIKIFSPEGVTIKDQTNSQSKSVEREAPRFAGEGSYLKPAEPAVVLDKISAEADVHIEEASKVTTRVKHFFKAGLWAGMAFCSGNVAYLTGKEIANQLAKVGGNGTTVALIAGTTYCAAGALSLMMHSVIKPNPKPKRSSNFEKVTVQEIKVPKATEGPPAAKAA